MWVEEVGGLVLGVCWGSIFTFVLCWGKLDFYKRELEAEKKYNDQMFDLYDKEIERLRRSQ